MQCGNGDKIHAYLRGRLNPQEAAEFERHLETCRICSQEVARERKLDSLLSAWETPEPRPGFSTRLKARLAEGAKASTPWFGLGRPAFSTISAVLIASGLALWYAWPRITASRLSPVRAEMVLAEHFEFFENLDMLEQWEMLQHWDEIAAVKPGQGKI